MRRGHDLPGRFFVAAAIALTLSTVTGFELAYHAQVVLLVATVSVLGLPHGALDLEIARVAGLWADRTSLVRFVGLYVGLAALTIGIWSVTPGLALTIFLAISAWHFAGDWRGQLSAPLRLGIGASIVSLPALFHPADVTQLFALLVPPAVAPLVTEGLRVAGFVSILATAIALSNPQIALEIIALVMAAAALPPLLFFVAYFCLLHSPRHLLEATARLRIATFGLLVRQTWPILLATWLGGAGALAVSSAATLSTAAVQVVFIGLAALTVPHMLLIEFWATRKPGFIHPTPGFNHVHS